jgi:hypothetical protein
MTDKSSSDAFLLGEIKATVTGTAEDIRAMRVEVGILAQRLSEAEKAVVEIQSERAMMVDDYRKFAHRVNNHMMADSSWKSEYDGDVRGSRRIIYGLYLMSMLAAALAGALVKLLV